MRLDLSNGLSEEILARIRKHSDGCEGQKSRVIECHYCRHKAIIVFEDSRGHIKAKCKRCGAESIYNVMFRRNGAVMYRRVTS